MNITQTELIDKLRNANPGLESAPDHPPVRVGEMTAPRQDCDRCSGTGWSWSEYWSRYFVCVCMTPRRTEYTPRAPYGGEQ